MLTTQRLYHPLSPAVGVAVAAATGLALTVGLAVGPGVDPGPAAGVWWALVGLASGYALSGSV